MICFVDVINIILISIFLTKTGIKREIKSKYFYSLLYINIKYYVL